MNRIVLMAGVMAVGLSACAQNGGVNIGQGFGMDANISGAKVSLTLTAATPTAPAKVQILITQPTVNFNARPQSVGLQLQKFTVEILDNAGTRYAADEGSYQRSASANPGYVCSVVDADNAAPPLAQCAPNDKTAANVPTAIGSLPIISAAVADQIASDCVTSSCPTLKMKVTFSGLDDAGRVQNIVVPGADLFVETK